MGVGVCGDEVYKFFCQVYEELEAIGADKAEAKARRILAVSIFVTFVISFLFKACSIIRNNACMYLYESLFRV